MVPEADVRPRAPYQRYFALAKQEYTMMLRLHNSREQTRASASPHRSHFEAKAHARTARATAEPQRMPLTMSLDERCILVIVLCTLTLEAFINAYGRAHLAQRYFTHYLDRLSLEAKWMLIPQLTVHRDFHNEAEVLETFHSLLKMRHGLTHAQTRYGEGAKPADMPLSAYGLHEAQCALRAVRAMVMKLHELDERVHTQWLAEA
jgi:hypothetical protein